MATLYKCDGTTEEVECKSLEDVQGHVGGYVEIVGRPDEDHLLLGNEEGRLIGLPVNPHHAEHGFVGPILLVKVPEEFN